MILVQNLYDDEFHTINGSSSNTLPPDWKEVFNVIHYAEDPSFDEPLKAKINNKDISLRVCVTNKKDKRIVASEGALSSIISALEGKSIPALEGANISTDDDDAASANASTNVNDASSETDGSIAQVTTRSGRVSMRPKKFLQTAILGLLSIQTVNLHAMMLMFITHPFQGTN